MQEPRPAAAQGLTDGPFGDPAFVDELIMIASMVLRCIPEHPRIGPGIGSFRGMN